MYNVLESPSETLDGVIVAGGVPAVTVTVPSKIGSEVTPAFNGSLVAAVQVKTPKFVVLTVTKNT